MARTVKPRRSYDASGRQERARQTRRAVLEIAQRRFLEDGYAATTVGAIASDANVSVETVYKSFGNKPGILKAMFDVAVVGDDEPIPLMERDEVRQNMAEPDPRKKLRNYGKHFAVRSQRTVPIQLLVREAAASDPAAADVWRDMEAERLTGMTAFARHLHEQGHLRKGVSVNDARDVLWAHISPELWELLVIKRGWKPERYGRWLADQLIAALLS
jgi:AcrR family transcriptional regulator